MDPNLIINAIFINVCKTDLQNGNNLYYLSNISKYSINEYHKIKVNDLVVGNCDVMLKYSIPNNFELCGLLLKIRL